MPLSQIGREHALAIRGDEAWITLLTIEHPSFATTLRYANQETDVVSRGNTYFRSGFQLELPSEGDGVPNGRVRVWNVRRQISRLVEQLETSPTITVELVYPSDLNTVIESFNVLELSGVIADVNMVEGALTQQSILDEPMPAGRMTEQYFPWLGR